MKKKCITLLLVFMMSFLCMGTALAQDIPTDRQMPLVVDIAGVLSEDELNSLNAKADQISEDQKCDVAVVFIDSLEGLDVQKCADDIYDYQGYGYGDNDDGILLLISVGDREYAFTTYSYAIDVFTDGRLADMEDRIIENLSENDWAGAAESYLDSSENYLIVGVPERPEKNHSVPLSALPMSLLFGLGLGYMPANGLKSQLKSVKKSSRASKYIEKNGVELFEVNDKLVNVTRIRNPIETPVKRSGGSSHHSTTHTSSSGRTHGGRSGRF